MTPTLSPVDVRLEFDQPADAAAAEVLCALRDAVQANLPAAIDDPDSEALHDLRVAVRRSRSVQRQLKRAFPPAELDHFRAEFRRLQGVTGPARDLDVYVLEFDELKALVPEAIRSDLDPLLGVLRRRREHAREKMAGDLRSERFTTLITNWSSLLPSMPIADRPDAKLPIGELAGKRIVKVHGRMVKMGDAIGPDSPPDAYHELRKKGKELRYLLELFAAALYAKKVVKPMIKSLKSLQDVLGRHQDRQVQQAMLRSLVPEVAALPDHTATLVAVGVLLASLDQDASEAQDQFAMRFAAFSRSKQRTLVKDTFG